MQKHYLCQLKLFQYGYSVHWFLLATPITLIRFHFLMTLLVVSQLSIFQDQPHVGLRGIHMQLPVNPREFRVTRARKLQGAHQRITQLDLRQQQGVWSLHSGTWKVLGWVRVWEEGRGYDGPLVKVTLEILTTGIIFMGLFNILG